MMKQIQLIHITPELPPTIGGIADYTAILSRRLAELSGGSVEPELLRAGWKEDEAIKTEFPAKDLGGQCSADTLARAITDLAGKTEYKTVVLLEYSGYGYAKRGAPVWLWQGLKKACGTKGIPLVTMFHELYATGNPWSSVFWMSPLQRVVAARLARLSSAVVTNRQQSANWLQKHMSVDKSPHVQPVFSNVGEPESVPPIEEREPYAVVFGGRGMKERLYGSWDTATDRFLQEAGVEKIIDIGSSKASFYEHLGWPVEAVGIQPVSAISGYLQKAKVGLIYNTEDYITKSGVWASYTAYAKPVLALYKQKAPYLVVGNNFLKLDNIDLSFSKYSFLDMGSNAFEWYKENAHTNIAAIIFLELISKAENQ